MVIGDWDPLADSGVRTLGRQGSERIDRRALRAIQRSEPAFAALEGKRCGVPTFLSIR